jgi:hypothetical protein
MRNKDINSVAYLFREMDPSEEMEFERQLEDNANLLIEVESFKKVNERLQDLPEISAPRNVLNSVIEAAAANSEKPPVRQIRPFYYAAAALLLAGFTAGAFLLDLDGSEAGSSAENTAVMGTPIIQLETTTNTSATTSGTVSATSATRQHVTPWVDNNEVIRFSDRIRPAESASIDSILRDSYQRLTPVTDPQQSRYYQRNLYLTGSRQ